MWRETQHEGLRRQRSSIAALVASLFAACWTMGDLSAEELGANPPPNLPDLVVEELTDESEARDPWKLLTESPGVLTEQILPYGHRRGTSLQERLLESDLVAVVVAGVSRFGSRQGAGLNVETELTIEYPIRGEAKSRRILYRHIQAAKMELDSTTHLFSIEDTSFEPGTQLLVFLRHVDDSTELLSLPRFESAASDDSVKNLKGSALAAYVERLEALEKLERGRGSAGLDPRELAEWFVATAESSWTRGDVMDDIAAAFAHFEGLAEEHRLEWEEAATVLLAVADEWRGLGRELPEDELPAFLGAAFTSDHRQRLLAALAASESFHQENLKLFGLVRGWDQKAAMEWLLARLATDAASPGEAGYLWSLPQVMAVLGDEEAMAVLSNEFHARVVALSEETRDLTDEQEAELSFEFSGRLLELLRDEE